MEGISETVVEVKREQRPFKLRKEANENPGSLEGTWWFAWVESAAKRTLTRNDSGWKRYRKGKKKTLNKLGVFFIFYSFVAMGTDMTIMKPFSFYQLVQPSLSWVIPRRMTHRMPDNNTVETSGFHITAELTLHSYLHQQCTSVFHKHYHIRPARNPSQP